MEWLTDVHTTQNSCITIMVIAAWAAISIALYDAMSLSGSLSSGDLLRGCALTDSAVMAGWSLFAINLALELIFFGVLIACLRDVEVLRSANCCGLLNQYRSSSPLRFGERDIECLDEDRDSLIERRRIELARASNVVDPPRLQIPAVFLFLLLLEATRFIRTQN
jgi:hypothetical protein